MRKIILSTMLSFLGFSAMAQVQQSNLPILLLNETVKPAEAPRSKAQIFNGLHFVIVQHPDLQLQKDFYGFHTFSYLPKKAAYAAVPQGQFAEAQKRLTQAGGSVLEINPRWKLSSKLFNDNYPDWAWLDGENMKIWLLHFPQLQTSQVVHTLAQNNIRVIDRKDDEQAVAVSFNPENIDQLTALPYVYYVQEMEDPGKPENFKSRNNHRVNTLQAPLGENIDGNGVKVGHGDDGDIGPHIDFKGRLAQGPRTRNSPPNSDHGDHVAGTIFGAGNLNPEGRGMAPGAEIYYQDYPRNLNSVDNNYTSLNVRITSSSYSNGCNAGYTNFTRQMDQDAFDNPELLHVFSAGNSNNNNCGYGAGDQWGNVTGGHKIGKNVIAVANLDDSDNINRSSSRGPASDGRIKPDVGAVGTQVFSTTSASGPNGYTVKTGTSMSCPGVSGTLAVLYEAYRQENNLQNPPNTLMKAILMNTTDDVGNKGPDFIHGYGRINARKAYELIKGAQYYHDSITSSSDSATFTINIPANLAQARFMIQWKDDPASTTAARALVNDLDMTVDSLQPWVLDPTANATNLNSPALRARDSLNNIEQVTLNNPAAGNVTVKVKAHNLPSGKMPFYLTYYFEKKEPVITYPSAGDPIVAGSIENIRWDAPRQHSSSFTLEYSADKISWNPIRSGIGNTNREFRWSPPSTLADDEVYVRISSNGDTNVTDPFAVMQVPFNLRIESSCPDSVTVAWDTVRGVDGYILYGLGAKYMDSVAFTTGNQISLPHTFTQEDWFSVSGVVNNRRGKRAIAVQRAKLQVENCNLEKDLAIEGTVPSEAQADCYDLNKMPVGLVLKNNGNNAVTQFDAAFKFNAQNFVVETLTDTIMPNQTKTVFFDSTISPNGISFNDLEYYVSLSADENRYNDSVKIEFRVYRGATLRPPFTEDFENQAPCGTASNCGATVCFLNDGWYNSTADDIDFRVNSGFTPSSGTGPTRDANPGTSAGRYAYLEASGGCDSAEALMLSPCVALDSVAKPYASFAYHMQGTDMGKLNVDVFDGNQWHNNVAPALSGNQGTAWQYQSFSLTPYVGKTIQVRFRGKTGDNFRSDVAIDDFSVIDSSAVGIEENNLFSRLSIFPNPTSGKVQVAINNNDAGYYTFTLRSVTGSLVQQSEHLIKNGSNTIALDMSDVPTGVYLLEIKGRNNATTTQRIMRK